MKISELLSSGKPTVSFEVFPPKTESGFGSVRRACVEIAGLAPDFMSVTYGAAGGARRYTIDLAGEIQQAQNLPVLAHFSCVGADEPAVDEMLSKLHANHLENVLALRGDLKDGQAPEHFQHASDLIRYIREKDENLCIGAACYPEGHPESFNKKDDLRHLKEKVEAGCDFLTTQMFFDNELFYRFLYQIREMGITIPVCAGIMPVTNPRQLERIGGLSGAFLPQKFVSMTDRFKENDAAFRRAGILYASSQIVDLLSNGIRHIHIYTMNKPDVAAEILKEIQEVLSYEIS